MRLILSSMLSLVVFGMKDFQPPSIWTEAEIIVLLDDQPLTDAEVTVDGDYVGESPSRVQLNNFASHEINIFIDQHSVYPRERNVEVSAGMRPTKIVINFTSR